MSIIEQCIKHIKQYLYIAKTDLIIDPCAGCMNFVNAIQHLSATSLFYSSDTAIENHHSILGSPADHLAPAFIKKCCEFADSISFILPFGLDDYFSEEYKLVFSIELPELSRSSHIKDRKVFQIWTKGAAAPLQTPHGKTVI